MYRCLNFHGLKCGSQRGRMRLKDKADGDNGYIVDRTGSSNLGKFGNKRETYVRGVVGLLFSIFSSQAL